MSESFLDELCACRRCRRLADYLGSIRPAKGRGPDAYWSRPVPGFGDPDAGICLVGLAPGAHGANRTGRPFTGDGAGDFMYPLLHRAGLSNQAEIRDLNDGLELRGLYITNAVKCAPPQNKPAPDEFRRCAPYLEEELGALKKLRVVLLLGQGAYASYLRLLKERGDIGRVADHPFAHGAAFRPSRNGPWVLASYHTSRYNVQTGRITQPMFLELLEQAKVLAGVL